MLGGYAGKIAFVNLTTGDIQIENLDQTLAGDYIGGQGLGARILFERQRKGADPLGAENILRFTTGPLTGTPTPTGGRYMAVCKSPLTGGWGDANSGGFFVFVLKAAGWDAVFISGIAAGPRYLLINDHHIELKDASQLWGKDTVETEIAIQENAGNKKIRIACIGPASENLSLIGGIINDRGRAAARSGVGAVMGAKQLKAVAVIGSGKTAVADPETLKRLRKDFVAEMREMGGFPDLLMKHGTCGLTAGLVACGASPVKNWQTSGDQSFPTLDKIGDTGTILKYQKRKFACGNVLIGGRESGPQTSSCRTAWPVIRPRRMGPSPASPSISRIWRVNIARLWGGTRKPANRKRPPWKNMVWLGWSKPMVEGAVDLKSRLF